MLKVFNITSEIIIKDSGEPGPILAIVAGIHGNETAGISALQQMLPSLMPKKGKLMIAFANTEAIKNNVRMINKNLNRCFYSGNMGDSAEDKRARELMAMLDECDALLDLHMFYGDSGVPFVICEEGSLDLAVKLDAEIISTNWTKTEPGASDGYMHLQGKIGICVECGPIDRAEQYIPYAKKTIMQFLKYFGMNSSSVDFSKKAKKVIDVRSVVYKKSGGFILEPDLFNFKELKEGQVLATEGDNKFIAKEGEFIIFPHYGARIGEEAYILGSLQI